MKNQTRKNQIVQNIKNLNESLRTRKGNRAIISSMSTLRHSLNDKETNERRIKYIEGRILTLHTEYYAS